MRPADLLYQPGSRSYPQQGLLARVHVDATLTLALFTAATVGLVVLYSASQQDLALLVRQVVRLGIGFAVMFAVAQIPPKGLRNTAPWAYSLGLALLAAVLLVGDVGKGAQRWLDIGFMRFQPSEILKIALPMMMAWLLGRKTLPPNLTQLLAAVLVIGTPVLLILKQPDLGTAVVVASSGAFALLLGGLSWRLMATVLALLLPAAPAFWTWGMRDYQRQRVLTLLDPESDPLGAGYHIIQSKIAIGSGGTYGKGWLNGTQAHLDFLPESATDFVFAVFAEEFGLYGSVALLALFVFIIARGLYIAVRAPDSFSRLLAGSLSLAFFVYLFVNVGMVIGLLPVVGLPLPLISYGGTSLVTVMAGFGILMSIHTHFPSNHR